MENYRHVLLATDFSDHCAWVAERAYDLAKKHSAALSLLNVVEYQPFGDIENGPIITFDLELSEKLEQYAKERMNQLGLKLEVPEERQWVEFGSPKSEIIRVAEEQKVDLIVLGSHGRRGIALLLGSTASSVMHRAPCDVLAVRFREQS